MIRIFKIIFMSGVFVFLILILNFSEVNKNVILLKQSEGGDVTLLDTYDGYAGSGRKVKQIFAGPPQRVVAVSESVVDNLLFLGVQDRLVAIAAIPPGPHSPYESEYQELKRIADNSSYPSREAFLLQNPDIIIGWGSLFSDIALGSVNDWHRRNIHTYVMSNTIPTVSSGNRRVANIFTDLQNLAAIFRVSEDNREKIKKLESRLAYIEEKTLGLEKDQRPTILTVQHVYGNEYFGRNATDLTADISYIAGGRSLDDEISGKQSVESLIKKNPDIIMVVDMQGRSAQQKINDLKNNRLLRNVTAVKNNNFFIIEHRAFYCGSFRTIEALEKLNRFIEERFH